jgi:predicted lipoprotein
MPLSEAVTDPAARARVEALRDQVSALEKLLASPAAEALDLPMGFNSLDGD